MAYQPNDGLCPATCLIIDDEGEIAGFKRVHVRLFGGFDSRKAGHEPWPAGGTRPPTRWKIGGKPHAFDIKEWELA